MATQIEVADHLDISDRQVRNLLKKGVIPHRTGPGGLDLDACRVSYIRYMRGQVMGTTNSQEEVEPPEEVNTEESPESIERAKEKEDYLLTRERRIAQQHKNDVNAHKVVPVDFAIYALAEVSAEMSTIFDTLTMVVHRKHPDLESRHLDTISREVAKVRNQAAGLGTSLPRILADYYKQIEG